MVFLDRKVRCHYKDRNAVDILSGSIVAKMEILNYNKEKELIIVCIGTDRSTGDSLGPLTGHFLEKSGLIDIPVYGTINNPVHASNLDENIEIINERHKNAFIIAIDAGLGKQSRIGYIDVKEGSLKPGIGVNKNLSEIGDMHLTGLVNVSGYMEYLVLQSTRLSIVMSLAEVISKSILKAVGRI